MRRLYAAVGLNHQLALIRLQEAAQKWQQKSPNQPEHLDRWGTITRFQCALCLLPI
jgi:hypothetical protein